MDGWALSKNSHAIHGGHGKRKGDGGTAFWASACIITSELGKGGYSDFIPLARASDGHCTRDDNYLAFLHISGPLDRLFFLASST
jgi:hypothetical protein